MDDAGTGLDDGDARILPHKVDESPAAAGYAHVDVSDGAEHGGGRFVGRGQERAGLGRQAALTQGAVD